MDIFAVNAVLVQANIGEVLEGRYKILGTSGRGVFSTVLICEDTQTGVRVAIKVIKANDTMRRVGEQELDLLEVCMYAYMQLVDVCVRVSCMGW